VAVEAAGLAFSAGLSLPELVVLSFFVPLSELDSLDGALGVVDDSAFDSDLAGPPERESVL
jgi:hypothetical protein